MKEKNFYKIDHFDKLIPELKKIKTLMRTFAEVKLGQMQDQLSSLLQLAKLEKEQQDYKAQKFKDKLDKL